MLPQHTINDIGSVLKAVTRIAGLPKELCSLGEDSCSVLSQIDALQAVARLAGLHLTAVSGPELCRNIETGRGRAPRAGNLWHPLV